MPSLKSSTCGLVVLLCASLGALATDSNAGSISYFATFPASPYLNSGTFVFPPASVPKFDQAGQCLTSVCVSLDGGVTGEIGFENYDNFPKTVNVYFDGRITLHRPDNTLLLTVLPGTTTTDNVTAYDGTLDYGGTSGRTYTGVNATQADSTCLASPADLALFTGAGTIGLPGTATDLSTQSGANSWSIGVKGYATIKVTYNFADCPVPADPTTWGRIKGIYR